MRLSAALIAVFLFTVPIAHAADDLFTRPTLKGLRGVAVIVTPQSSEVQQNGLTTSAIQTDVELKLRQAGIPILELNLDNVSAPTFAQLHVNVSVFTHSDGIWPFAIRIDVSQAVSLKRDPSIVLNAATWDETSYGMVGKQNVRSVRDGVKGLVDKFINAYLAMNPKK